MVSIMSETIVNAEALTRLARLADALFDEWGSPENMPRGEAFATIQAFAGRLAEDRAKCYDNEEATPAEAEAASPTTQQDTTAAAEAQLREPVNPTYVGADGVTYQRPQPAVKHPRESRHDVDPDAPCVDPDLMRDESKD
jgi:hypothetical protein